MHDVFISYYSGEMRQAETVRDVLEQNGFPCWMAPRDIPGGSNYTKEIPVAIRGAQVFVLMLSSAAQESPWVLKELDMAVNCGKVILPFMLEEFPLSDEFNFLLTGAQRYAAYQKKSDEMEKLVSRVRAIVGEKKAETPAAARENESNEPERAPAAGELSAAQRHGKAEEPAKPVTPVRPKICCKACGSVELAESRKFVRVDAAEYLTLLLVPVMAVAGFIFAAIVVALLNVVAGIGVGFVGFFIGGILGERIAREWIRRRRVRAHKIVRSYRCKKCAKRFSLIFTDQD